MPGAAQLQPSRSAYRAETATHVGGNGAPDGVLTAPLGIASYRSVLECKTAAPGNVVANPRPEEAAKFRAGVGATTSILLGPAFANDASLDDELRTHAVALWSVDDLATALALQLGPDELRPLLAPGRAESALGELAWEREHGRRKRVAVIADRLARAVWHTRVVLARQVSRAETPALTEDTLLVLIDEALAAEGIPTARTSTKHAKRSRSSSCPAACAVRIRRISYANRRPPASTRLGERAPHRGKLMLRLTFETLAGTTRARDISSRPSSSVRIRILSACRAALGQ